jgi:hypothetical protein
MKGWLAIVAYQCQVAGVATDSIDFQVRYFELATAQEVKAALRAEPPHDYANDEGEAVRWHMVEIFAIQEVSAMASGDELVGFISGAKELTELSRPEAPDEFAARG